MRKLIVSFLTLVTAIPASADFSSWNGHWIGTAWERVYKPGEYDSQGHCEKLEIKIEVKDHHLTLVPQVTCGGFTYSPLLLLENLTIVGDVILSWNFPIGRITEDRIDISFQDPHDWVIRIRRISENEVQYRFFDWEGVWIDFLFFFEVYGKAVKQ